VLTGSNLSSYTNASAGRDSSFLVYAQSGTQGVTAEANIHRLSGDQLALTLPASLPTGSMYLIWPKNENGTGKPAVINRTEAWWVGPNKIVSGDSFSIFGRNLSNRAYLQYPNGSGEWLTASTSNGYKSNFVFPSTLGAGTYKVWAHNGLGGKYGWGKAINITVTAPYTWSSTQFNVMNYGATGDGVTDDSTAINNAIAAAENVAGSSVIFPAGTYIMGTANQDYQRTDMKWIGAGKDQTKIIAKPNFNSGVGLFYGGYINMRISGITFDTGGSMTGALYNTLLRIRNSSDVHFDDVRITQQKDPAIANYTQSALDFTGSTRMFFTNCEFIEANGAFSGNSQQVFFDNCTFKGINDANALLYVWNGSQVSVTNCTASDFNRADIRANGNGWAQGRFMTGRGGTDGAISDLYFGNNTTVFLFVQPTNTENQNTGEQFMFEGLDTVLRAQASGGTSNTVTLASGSVGSGYGISIVAGKGRGQSRLITGGSGGNLTVDEPWSVIPDSTSTVMVGSYLTRTAVIGNSFDGKAETINDDTGSTGVEPYGGSSNVVVANNSFHDLRKGIMNFTLTGTYGGTTFLQPNFFNDFKNNTFSNCVYGIRNNVGNWEAGTPTYDVVMMGSTYRGNQIAATEDGISFWSYGINGSSPTIGMNIFQGNTVNAKRGWTSELYPNMVDQILVVNPMTSSGTVGASLNVSAQKLALRENTWTPSATAYSGPKSGVLEMPKRVAHLDMVAGASSGTGAFTVWNSGTDSLSWSASTSTSWLTLSNNSGTISNENSSGAFNFTANASSLSAGDYIGVISVTGGGKTQQVTVTLTVTGSLSTGNGTGLKGEYFAGMNFNTLIKSQIDPTVNFDWGNGNPKNLNGTSMTSIGNDNFSVRWTGQVQAIESGTYTFTTTTDDGARLWIGDVNGTPLIDKWINQAVAPWSGNVTLVAGQKYNIRFDYFEDGYLSEARLSWLRPNAGTSQIIPQSQLYPTLGVAGGSGTITREVWTNSNGNSVNAIPLTTTPNIVDTLTSMEAPTDWTDAYGTRLRGYITPPTTGNYTFWIAGDDATELWLSTNNSAANKVKIAYNTTWTSSREWNKFTTQQSAAIPLTAGQKYYVEALHQDGGGGDNLAVGWLKPGESGTAPSEVVPGTALSPMP